MGSGAQASGRWNKRRFGWRASLVPLFLAFLANLAFAAEEPAVPEAAATKGKVTEEQKQAALASDVTQGALRIVQDDGTVVECPLKHTDVQADIAGFVARVRVTQTFHNPTKEKIEAVYVFPLPHESAVDEMTMVIGERRIVGKIKRRDEARQAYAEAIASGRTAALLEQERPNIFTQTVGNIEPGQDVKIEIGYVDILRYDVGAYEFAFPMVVGPRYNPGAPISTPAPNPPELQGKVSPPAADTTRVPDASRISPPVLKPGVRNGHDVSLTIKLDAGVPIRGLKSANHKADIIEDGDRRATIELAKSDNIPNKDFVLRYEVVGEKPEMALLAHTAKRGDARRLGEGYFMLMVQPKEDDRLKKSPPRELVFLVDVSGSMSGEPTAKVIDAMQNMLKLCRENDTVQVITFASQANKLFEKPVPCTKENIKKAINFSQGLAGGGGTEMLKGVKLAIDEPIDKERVRIVVMLTDGYIGNEAEIIEHVGKNCGDQVRFWCIGIGSSPNMFLIDGVAKQGGGMGKQLGLQDDTAALTQEVITRIQRAQLSKVKIDWGGLKVAETYPAKIPELWAGRPVVVFGRYSGSGEATIAVEGSIEGEPARWPLEVSLPAEQKEHDALAKVWARRKIEDLMQQTYYQGSPAVEEEVTGIALDYQLMSQYTSFVAIDEDQLIESEPAAKPPRRMLVPVPLPEGTRWEGFFGPVDGEREFDGVALESDSDHPVPADEFAGRASGALDFGTLGKRVSNASAPSAFGLPAGGLPAAPHPAAMPAVKLATSASPSGGTSLAPTAKQASPANGPARFGRFGGAAGSGGSARSREVLRRKYYPADAKPLSYSRDATDFLFVDPRVQHGQNFAAEALLGEKIEATQQAASEALASAKQSQGALKNGRAAYERAALLDLSAMASGQSSGDVTTEATSALQQMRDEAVAVWKKEQPALSRKLDVVLRHQTLEQAIETVAAKAGIKVRIVPGSLDDAASLVGDDQMEVVWLDLRGATTSQALDWLLAPVRLNWELEKGEIVVASRRRMDGTSSWVYDVSLIALPDGEALAKLEHAAAVKAARDEADEFLAAMRENLGKDAAENVVWYGPGQLLVTGDQRTHATIGQRIADLADSKVKPRGKLAELQKKAIERVTSRKAAADKRTAAIRRLHAAQLHSHFGWQLLAAAAAGQVDDEAVTQLQHAWKVAATDEMLKQEQVMEPLVSLWTIVEANRMLQAYGVADEEVEKLLQTARKKAKPAVANVLKQAKEKPDDAAALTRLLLAARVKQDDAAFVREALPLLTKNRPADSGFQGISIIARSLLAEPSEKSAAELAAFCQEGPGSQLGWVLTALAAQRQGDDAWQAFRTLATNELGKQPMPGSVVVLISRLGNHTLMAAR